MTLLREFVNEKLMRKVGLSYNVWVLIVPGDYLVGFRGMSGPVSSMSLRSPP
jgi:hypothetical protein